MHPEFSKCSTSSQEEYLDPATFIAEIDAIVRAPHKPMPPASSAAGITRQFDHLARRLGITLPAPSLEEEMMAQLRALEDDTLDLGPPPPPPPPYRSTLLDIVAKIAAMKPDAANDDAPTRGASPRAPAPARRVGHLVTRRHRKSDVRSKLTREKTKQTFLGDLAERGIAFSREITPLSSPSNHTHTANDNRNPEDWKRSTEIGKFSFYQRALYEFGEPYAWTLDISPDEVAAGITSKNFATRLLKRIAKYLRLELGRDPVIVLAIDVTTPKDNAPPRPHAHGGGAFLEKELPAVQRALRRAGGPWVAPGFRYQVKTRRMFDPDGWAAYSTRNLTAARKVVGANVIAASGDLKVAAKALHRRLRDRVIAAAA